MNKKVIDNLLRMAITASLTQREFFVEKVSAILEDKMGTDPENAHKVGEDVMSYLADLKDEMVLKDIFAAEPAATADNSELSAKIDELTAAINKLNENLQK